MLSSLISRSASLCSKQHRQLLLSVRRLASNVSLPDDLLRDPSPKADAPGAIERISKAMKTYLERAEKYDLFLLQEKQEFDLGKRHLCNIMGWDANNINQKDIDKAIEYLMPSGLFEPRARPVMKPPEELYPKRKAAEFDVLGKPHHTLFYTSKPNYFQVLHDIHETYLNLNKIEDEMLRKGVLVPHHESRMDLSGTEWLNYEEMKALLLERFSEEKYSHLIRNLEILINHPYSRSCKDFLMKYRKAMISVTAGVEMPPPTYTEDGRIYAAAEGKRKTAVAQVTVWGNGTGRININGKDLLYFEHIKERIQIMFPLQFTKLMFKVDIDAKVEGGGVASQAGAVRHGISVALKSFVEPSVVEDMRLMGLLTKDRRIRERKKPGRRKARKGFFWRKR